MFLRRVTLFLLDPRPPIWASAALWGTAAAAVLFVLQGWLKKNEHSFSTSFMFDASLLSDGKREWKSVGFLNTTEIWRISLATSGRDGIGQGNVKTVLSIERVTPAKEPLPPFGGSELAKAEEWIADQAARDSELSSPKHNRHLAMALDMIRHHQTDRSYRTWWRWAIDGVRALSLIILIASPFVAFLRGSQSTWYHLQLRRASAGRCPGCNFETAGLPTDICPECGINRAAALAEAHRALRGS